MSRETFTAWIEAHTRQWTDVGLPLEEATERAYDELDRSMDEWGVDCSRVPRGGRRAAL